jgi:hypothetical protein
MWILGSGRRGGRLSMRAVLWYPDGAAVRGLVARELGDGEASRLGPVESPVPGTVRAVHDALGWDTAFQTDDGAPVPVLLAGGALFLASSVAPQGVNRTARDGTPLTCWLGVPQDASLAERRRLTEAGWRLGRARDAAGAGGR